MAEAEGATSRAPASPDTPFPLPRVTIQFCTQCKWMLRAAYFAQELLSTFSTSLGEVALQPSTGGTFVVTIFFLPPPAPPPPYPTDDTASTPTATVQQRVLWDRKRDGGFPETKELKRRVRDAIEPGRNLGHVDRDYGSGSGPKESAMPAEARRQAENALALNTHPDVNIGDPACKPGTESARTNAKTEEECEDCK